MRLFHPLSVAAAGVLVAAVIAVGCQTPAGAGSAAGSRGERFFQMKCNSCHPGGGQGAGPPIDASIASTFLERGKTSGRHAVPEGEWEPLIAFLNDRFGVGAAPAEAPAVAPPAGPGVAAPVGIADAGAAAAAAAAAAGVDTARGQALFQARCNRCHPNGGRGVGPAVTPATLPGPLKSSPSGGRHDVPPEDYANLIAFLGGSAAAAPGAVVAAPATPPPPPAVGAAVAAGDAAVGASYFLAKCNMCHAGGKKIAGKVVPGVLTPDGGGKHGVPAAMMDNLVAHLLTLGAVRAGGAAAAAPTPAVTTPAVPTPAVPTPAVTTPAAPTPDGAIPNNAGMVPCACSCQCPPGAPPAAIPAACICQCSCPR